MRRLGALSYPTIVAVLIALACASALVLVAGGRPLEVYRLLWDGTWGTAYGMGQVLFKATPLMLTGLSVALAYRARLFNIGAEGQMTLGAFACAMVGAALPPGTPGPIAVTLALVATFAAGAALAAIAGALKAFRGAHEVITTIMLNYVVRAIMVGVGAHVFLRETIHTTPIVPAAELPRLSSLVPALHGSAVNGALALALVAAAATAWLLFRTRTGFRLRALGAAPLAAETSGIPVRVTTLLALALSGGLAGLAGANFVLGYKHYYEDGFSGGIGYMGIAVAMAGRAHPLGVVLAALLFGTLSQGALAVNALVPKEMLDVLQAVVILVVAATLELRRKLREAIA